VEGMWLRQLYENVSYRERSQNRVRTVAENRACCKSGISSLRDKFVQNIERSSSIRLVPEKATSGDKPIQLRRSIRKFPSTRMEQRQCWTMLAAILRARHRRLSPALKTWKLSQTRGSSLIGCLTTHNSVGRMHSSRRIFGA